MDYVNPALDVLHLGYCFRHRAAEGSAIKGSVLPNRYQYINKQADWDAVASQLRDRLDWRWTLSANGRYAYRERICLLQISDGDQTYLLDPLTVDDLSALGRILMDESVVKAIHGSEEDIRFLSTDFGFFGQQPV